MRSRTRKWRVLSFAAFLLVTLACRPGGAASDSATSRRRPGAETTSKSSVRAAPARISVHLHFRTLWWSPDQMNQLNPNSPPPKKTEVTIQKWEYSDPIGVPHPDTVDLVIEVVNESGESADVVADAKASWRVGPFRDEKGAEWGPTTSLRREGPTTLGPHQTHTLRAPVDIARRMAELNKSDAWPYALRVGVEIVQAGSGVVLGSAQKELPILRGD